jgi:Ca2+-transporting ATPase
MNDKDALKPDPGTEADFEVENNKFAFSPGQLAKLYNPKSVRTTLGPHSCIS